MNLKQIRQYFFGQDIFISHRWNEESKNYSLQLAKELEKRGLDCFVDYNDINAGDNIPTSIQRAIKKSKMFLLVTHSDVLVSRWIPEEIKLAVDGKRKIIPLNVGNTIETFDFEMPHWKALKDVDRVEETLEAYKSATPSVDVLLEIDRAFTARRSKARLTQSMFVAAFVLLLVTVVPAVWGLSKIARLNADIDEKNGILTELNTKANEAENRAKSAESDKNKANDELTVIRTEIEAAIKDRDAFKNQKEIAEGDRDKAKSEAAKQKEIAKVETARAIEQTRKAADAEKLKKRAETETAIQARLKLKLQAKNEFTQAQTISTNETEQDRALLWAQKAIYTVPIGEKERSLYKLRLLQMTRNVKKSINYVYENQKSNIIFNPLNQTVFSQTGPKAITISNQTLAAWDMREGQQIMLPNLEEYLKGKNLAFKFHPPIFSPNEDFIAFLIGKKSSKGQEEPFLEVWDIKQDKLKSSFSISDLDALYKVSEQGQQLGGFTFSFSPDSTSLLVIVKKLEITKNATPDKIYNWKLDSEDTENSKYGKTIETWIPPVLNSYQNQNSILTGEFNKKGEFVSLTSTNLTDGSEKRKLSTDDNKRVFQIELKQISENKIAVIFNKRVETGLKQELEILELNSMNSIVTKDLQNSLKSSRDLVKNGFEIVGFTESRIFLHKQCHTNKECTECLNGIYVFDLIRLQLENDGNPKILLGKGNFSLIKVSAFDDNIVTEVTSNPRDGKEIKLWDEKTGTIVQRPIKVFDGKYYAADKTVYSIPQDRVLVAQNIKSDNAKDISEVDLLKLGSAPVIQFNSDNNLFLILTKTGISLHSLVDKSLQFTPIPGDFSQVRFSKDGSHIKTLKKIPDSKYLLETWLWDTATNIPYPTKNSIEFPDKYILTEDYKYLIGIGDQGKNFQLCEINNKLCWTNNDKSHSNNFYFPEREDASLAIALLTKADSVDLLSADSIEIQFGANKFRINSEGVQGTKIRDSSDNHLINFPYVTTKDYTDFRISRNGMLVLAKEGNKLNLREIRSGELIMSDIWYGDGKDFEFSADGKHFYILTESGKIKAWYIGLFNDEIPAWMTDMAEALTGNKINKSNVIEPLSQEDYLKKRDKFRRELNEATKNDEEAKFVSDNWQQ